MAKKKSIEVKRYCKESREYSMMGNCGSPIDGDGEIDDLCERLNLAPAKPKEGQTITINPSAVAAMADKLGVII